MLSLVDKHEVGDSSFYFLLVLFFSHPTIGTVGLVSLSSMSIPPDTFI